jgi:hypothetical protein
MLTISKGEVYHHRVSLHPARMGFTAVKIILFYSPSFWFKTYEKVLEQAPDQDMEAECRQAVVVFYQVEEGDPERRGKVLTKLLKNIKWLAGKFDSRTLVLHSFNHLSMSKAPAEFADALIEDARTRLEQSGYSVTVTPFGYLNEWKLHVAGESLAKVFKEL